MSAATCERCGAGRACYSHRLEQLVCWGCYHATFTPAEVAESERAALQNQIANAIRSAADEAQSRGALADRALLMATAASADEVVELLGEVERLGVMVEMPS